MRVLVVEDDALVGLTCEQVLASAGHHVVGVCSRPLDAFEAAQDTPPDLALMNVHLHGRPEGLDCARVLREQFGALVIFIGGDVETAREAADVALGSLAKPFTAEALEIALAFVEKLMAGQDPGRVPPGLELFETTAGRLEQRPRQRRR